MKGSQRTTQNTLFGELAGLSRTLFVIIAFMIGILIMIIAFAIGSDPAIRDPSILNWSGAIGQEILIAIGTSILASIVFYVLYSKAAEERVLKEISVNAAQAAVDYATGLFQTRFEKMLPAKIYPATDSPVVEFDRDFDGFLRHSSIYKFKGDAAGFTVYRLTSLCERGYSLNDKEITLVLIDPRRDDLLEERARSELAEAHKSYTRVQLAESMREMRLSIFVSIVSLFDISHVVQVELGLHQEHLFFRTELLDEALFLTYYLGGDFPGTYLYSQETFAYKAYLQNFRQSFAASAYRLTFSGSMTEDDLSEHLQTLGCQLSVTDLRQMKETRFDRYRQMTRY